MPARVAAAVVVSVLIAVAACGHQDAATRAPSVGASPDSSDSSVYAAELEKSDLPWSGSPSPYNAEVKLSDGRRVALHYRRGKGLVEQHYSPRAKAWTEPKVVYRTRTDACQGIQLRTRNGTVAVIADFGSYCYDGEPPTESIAAVGVGNLTEWSVNVTKNFDGWERATVSEDGQRVVFGSDPTLNWSRTKGFEGR
ncbi:hypothetical protein OG223_49965 [Streptomyces sp. NBC_01478]|uniref:hypothetical protein n=1 Tax=Streptomyces sp. NBC_01478 TaxID=2903882 RepID=UPI002E2F1FAD|nr:hypothetical protein [Streptomyces sp. NBC_01478]